MKIGWARDPVQRVATFQIGNQHLLTIIGVVPGTRRRERDIQDRFWRHRAGGEWFHFDAEMTSFIRVEGFECSDEIPYRFIDLFPEYARSSLTVRCGAEDYDALRDKSYRDTALGSDVVAWLAWEELGGLAERTLDQYERDLSRACLLYPSKGLHDFTDIELGHIVRSWPKPSRRVRKAALDTFFKWAIRTRRIEQNPMALLPSVKRQGKRVLDLFTEAEIEDALSLPLHDSVLMALLFEAGLRRGEAIALQVRRLKLEPTAQVIVVGGKGDKDRIVPLSSMATEIVRGFLLVEGLGPQDRLWYNRPGGTKTPRRSEDIVPTSFDRWWRRSLATAGIRYRNPHMARHTFALRWLRGMVGHRAGEEAGRPGRLETLSRVMGHASIQTTFDLYGHLDLSDAHADLALMEKTPD